MNRGCIKGIILLVGGTLLPVVSKAQSMAGEINSLHKVLDGLYEEMIPLCHQLIGVGRGVAGFAALWYIAARVWRHIANAEPVDFYPLLRPFAIGMVILLFPAALNMVNGFLKPTVLATEGMVKNTNQAITLLLKRKEEAIKKSPDWQVLVGENGYGDRQEWYKYTNPEGVEEGIFEAIGNDMKFAMAKASYNFRNSIKQWMSEILHILYEAAALCINTIRTFILIVLAILGPLVFGLSVFDGFQHTLTVWIARYINVFMWLPVANIFGSIIGKVQENMLKLDIHQVGNYGDTFFSATDTAYLIFMVIGIVGYLTVPSVANYIVHASGGNTLLYKVSNLFTNTSRTALLAGSAGAGMAADALGDAAGRLSRSMASLTTNSGYFKDDSHSDKGSDFMYTKLKG